MRFNRQYEAIRRPDQSGAGAAGAGMTAARPRPIVRHDRARPEPGDDVAPRHPPEPRELLAHHRGVPIVLAELERCRTTFLRRLLARGVAA